MNTGQLFARDPSGYARFRPTYPAALFEWIADQAPRNRLAWDCATGNGQAARGLARHFAHVAASDISASQIQAANRDPGITYFVGSAESSSLGTASVDAIAVAQALHWFDLPTFYAEARRVLVPGGVLVAWGYFLGQISPAVDEIVNEYYRDVLGRYWSLRIALLGDGYANANLPFTRLDAPPVAVEANWTLDELEGYLGTWSAVGMYMKEKGLDPYDVIRGRLAAAWGDRASNRQVVWPLHVVAGRA